MLNCGHQQLLVPNVFKLVCSYEMRAGVCKTDALARAHVVYIASLVLLKFPIGFVHESVAHGTPHTGDTSVHPFSA